MAQGVQQAVQVADHSLHGGLGVLHREAGEGPATVVEGEVSTLEEWGQAGEPRAEGRSGKPPSYSTLTRVFLSNFLYNF